MKTLKKRNRQFAEIMERAAEQLLVSRQTISNWENGKSLPDILSIVRMSELYGLSLDELIKGDEGVMKKNREGDPGCPGGEKNHKVCMDINCIRRGPDDPGGNIRRESGC